MKLSCHFQLFRLQWIYGNIFYTFTWCLPPLNSSYRERIWNCHNDIQFDFYDRRCLDLFHATRILFGMIKVSSYFSALGWCWVTNSNLILASGPSPYRLDSKADRNARLSIKWNKTSRKAKKTRNSVEHIKVKRERERVSTCLEARVMDETHTGNFSTWSEM